MTLGALGYVGYGLETVEGEFVAPTIFLPISSFNFDNTNDYIIPDQTRGSRDRYIAMPAPYATSGTMDLELVPLGISGLLRSAFAAGGALVTSSPYAGGGYEHTFTPGGDSPTFTFEANAIDILAMRYGGIRVNTLEIGATFGEIVTSSWGLEGTTRMRHEGALATETFAVQEPFHFVGASVSRDGEQVCNVKSFTFSVGNNLDRIGTLCKTRNWNRTVMGWRDVGLSLMADFDSTDDMELFLSEAEFSILLHLEGGFVSGTSGPKNTLAIEIPRVRWNSIGLPLNPGDILEQTVEAIILRPMNGDPVLTAKLVNSEATVLGA
jgi:hypothetical protein